LENGGDPVFDHADVDVKFDERSEMFLMVYGNVDDSHLYWTESRDGIEWLAHDGDRRIDDDPAHEDVHNPGLGADPEGRFSRRTIVGYGSGPGDWGVWDMDQSEIIYRGGHVDLPGCDGCLRSAAASAARPASAATATARTRRATIQAGAAAAWASQAGSERQFVNLPREVQRW
jgi:hypothetical protein